MAQQAQCTGKPKWELKSSACIWKLHWHPQVPGVTLNSLNALVTFRGFPLGTAKTILHTVLSKHINYFPNESPSLVEPHAHGKCTWCSWIIQLTYFRPGRGLCLTECEHLCSISTIQTKSDSFQTACLEKHNHVDTKIGQHNKLYRYSSNEFIQLLDTVGNRHLGVLDLSEQRVSDL